MTAEPLDLDAIRERVAAATDGPWARRETVQADTYVVGPGGLFADDVVCGPTYQRDNAEFIAHARDDVPALLAEVDRLRAALARAEDVASVHRVDGERARAALATARRDALTEAAEAVEAIDPNWDSALWIRNAAGDGVYVPVPDWLRARAEHKEGR